MRQWSRNRKALVGLAVSVTVLVGGAAGVFKGVQHWLSSNIEHIGNPFADLDDRPDPAPKVDGKSPMNLLVLGSDSRISAGDPSKWQAGAQRTDAIMLVHLPADRSGAYVMSIPRDAWVDIPGHGQAKINAAFSYGGASLLIATVEKLTKVRIDHFVVTDFESFVAMTNALGGVRMTLSKDLKVGDTVVPAGSQQLLTGEQALVFVRERKNLARGDFDRVQRQQAWIRAMAAKLHNDGTLSNPVASTRFLATVSRSVAADDGFNESVQRELVSRVRALGSADMEFFTVPCSGTGRSSDGQSIVVLDRKRFDPLMAAVATGNLEAYVAAHAADLDVLPPVVR
ncbi:MAG: LCP family protein [Micrococcales bacterium]|nr:LCP family protein [Micrococcales bacterium]